MNRNFYKKRIGFRLSKTLIFQMFLGLMLFGTGYAQKTGEKTSTSVQSTTTQKIKGKVVDETGKAISGANIHIVGGKNATQTDFEGNFVIQASANAIFRVSYVGMETVEVAAKDGVQIVLKMAGQKLDDVVVVGYGKQKKANLSGAVASVSTKTITNRPVTSLTNALQGSTPGLVVSSPPGDVGNDMGSIVMRGAGNLGSSSPLYVIDGVIQGSDFFNRLHPQDIESVSVLKDAASAAIYGSRAAYGVIIVTTKKGKAGKSQISYNTYYGTMSPTYLPKKVDAVGYMKLYDEARVNAGQTKLYDTMVPDPRDPSKMINPLEVTRNQSMPDFYPNTNWYDYFLLSQAPQSEHEVNISGGGDTRYYISGSLYDQNSLFASKKIKRYAFRANLDSKVNDKFTVSSNTSYTRDGYDNGTGNFSFIGIDGATPIAVAKHSDGSYGSYQGGIQSTAYSRELRQMEEGGWSTYATDRFTQVFKGTYKPFEGFEMNGTASYSLVNSYNNGFTNKLPNLLNFLTKAPIANTGVVQNQYYELWGKYARFFSDITMSYDKKWDDHQFKVLGGASFEDIRNKDISVTRKGYINNDLSTINGGSKDPANTIAGGGMYEGSYQSFFGRLNYSYLNKLFFESTFRYDGTSKFPVENRFGAFPSFSLAYRLSQESFMEQFDWLSEMKFRLSWGQLGNTNNVGYYDYYDSISIGQKAILDNVVQDGTTPDRIYNPSLGWERVSMTNVGVDLGFFKNKLNVTVDWYNKKTDGILLSNPFLPDEAGIGSAPPINAGIVSNKGIEFSASYNGNIGDLKYTVGGNFSRNWNKVLDLGGTDEIVDGKYIHRVGEQVNSFYMWESEGLFVNADDVKNHAYQSDATAPGDIKYKDQNNDGIIDAADRVVVGNETPNFVYGLNLTVNYKNFDFSIIGQGTQGGKIYLDGETAFAFFNGAGAKQYIADSHWTVDNPDPNAAYPRILPSSFNSHNRNESSFWLFDTSYFRVKALTVGYTLPKDLLERIKMDNIRLYVTANNPFTIRGDKRMKDFDPEYPSTRASYPVLKSIAIGLNVTF